MWKVGGDPEKNTEWGRYRHDGHNSGNYGTDTTGPAGMKVKVRRFKKQAKVSWKAPGQNGVSNGKVSKYEIYRSAKPVTLGTLKSAAKVKPPKIGEPNSNQSVRLKAKTRKKFFFAIRARDSVGNWSQLANTTVRPFKVKYKLIKKKRKVCTKKLKKRTKRLRGNKRQIKKANFQYRKCVYRAKKAGGLSPKKPKKHGNKK